MGGWYKTTIQVEAPISGAIVVYGTNNSGFQLGVTQGNANLATDFQPVQVTNLATGTAVNSISAAGNYKYEVNAQFLRLQGSPAAAGTAVYGLKFFHSKID
jgi:hypothetical protein